jgi:hypothetical protein
MQASSHSVCAATKERGKVIVTILNQRGKEVACLEPCH